MTSTKGVDQEMQVKTSLAKAPEPIIIEFTNVSKRYRRTSSGGPRRLRSMALSPGKQREARKRVHWALNDVTFAIARGETIGLLGANGSGKSTLLRTMAGVTRPTSGVFTVGGIVSGLLTIGEGFHPMLTGTENAITGSILAGLSMPQAQGRLDSVAEFAELQDYMDQPLRTYSDGMRLRLAFSVAIHVDPQILLIDEILAVGDFRFRQKCLNHIDSLQQEGVTIIVASHDLVQLERISTRCLWMMKGKLQAMGPASEVISQYRLAMQAQMDALAPPVVSQADGSIRIGSHSALEIHKVRLFDAAGRENYQIVAGASLRVEIEFEAHESLDGAIFGVSGHKAPDGTRCFDLSTDADRHALGTLKGPGVISLTLERLDLAGGDYTLAVGAYAPDWTYPYDYLWEASTFEVVADTQLGEFTPPHIWRLDD